MAIGEASAVNGDKPQAYAGKSASAGSVTEFNEALGRSSGAASSTQAERRPPFVQDELNQVGGGENLEPFAKMGEDVVKAGGKKEDSAPLEIQAKALADPLFKFVEEARTGWDSQFPSYDEFKKDLTAQVAYANEQARTNGLNPLDPLEGAEWTDPAAATDKWHTYVFAEYDEEALKNEAAGLRHVGEVGSTVQNAILEGLGLSAALGPGGAILAAGGEALALPRLLESCTGISTIWLGQFAELGLGTSFGMNLGNRSQEAIEVGSNPISLISAAATDTFDEMITNKSNLTGEDLNLSTIERMAGGTSDLLDGGMTTLAVRELAKAPEVGEPPVPRLTSAANHTPTSIQKQSSTGSTGLDDIADIPDSGDSVKLQSVTGADAPKVASSASAAVAARADIPVPTKSVDQIVDAHLKRPSPAEIKTSVIEGDLARTREEFRNKPRKNGHDAEIADQASEDDDLRMAMVEAAYRHYNLPAAGKPRPEISEAQLNDQLQKFDGPIQLPDDWNVRMNKSSAGIPADHSWVNANQAYHVDAASGGSGADSNGSGGDQREQRRHRQARQPFGRKPK